MSYETPSRRLVLKAGLLAGGGLLLSLHLPRAARAAETPPGTEEAAFVPNAFIEVPPSGKIIFISPHAEVGQGIYTSTAMLMAEELDLGLDQIAIQPAPPDLAKYKDPLLGDQATGGSASTRSDWIRLRQAAAATRIMLVGAAASRWHVDPADCQVARGVISHAGSGRTVTYGDVAGDAAGQPVPTNIPLKPAAQFTLIGTSAPRIDTPAKVNGTAQFGIDTILPGMKIGTLAITPVRGGTVASMDTGAARQAAGVRDIVVAPDKSAVAVFGDHMWAATTGACGAEPHLGTRAECQRDHHGADRRARPGLAASGRDRQTNRRCRGQRSPRPRPSSTRSINCHSFRMRQWSRSTARCISSPTRRRSGSARRCRCARRTRSPRRPACRRTR